MNKAELIEVVASRIDASKKDAAEAVQAVVDAIQEAVATGQKVSISGFGVFERAARPARTYRKPSTGEAIRKMATSVPKFRPGGDFKAFVSGEKNIADAAVKAARGAGEGVSAAAGNVVEQALAAVGRPARKSTAEKPASAAAPTKRSAPARATKASKAASAPQAEEAETTAPAVAVPEAPEAPEAPVVSEAPEAVEAVEAVEVVPEKKAPVRRAPAKRAAKAAASAEVPPIKQAAAKRPPAKRATKATEAAQPAPAEG